MCRHFHGSVTGRAVSAGDIWSGFGALRPEDRFHGVSILRRQVRYFGDRTLSASSMISWFADSDCSKASDRIHSALCTPSEQGVDRGVTERQNTARPLLSSPRGEMGRVACSRRTWFVSNLRIQSGEVRFTD